MKWAVTSRALDEPGSATSHPTRSEPSPQNFVSDPVTTVFGTPTAVGRRRLLPPCPRGRRGRTPRRRAVEPRRTRPPPPPPRASPGRRARRRGCGGSRRRPGRSRPSPPRGSCRGRAPTPPRAGSGLRSRRARAAWRRVARSPASRPALARRRSRSSHPNRPSTRRGRPPSRAGSPPSRRGSPARVRCRRRRLRREAFGGPPRASAGPPAAGGPPRRRPIPGGGRSTRGRGPPPDPGGIRSTYPIRGNTVWSRYPSGSTFRPSRAVTERGGDGRGPPPRKCTRGAETPCD